MAIAIRSKRTLYLLRYLTILTALGLVLYIVGNGNYTLFDNSETNYSAVAQEITNTGDPLSMHYNGTNWYVHPPLYFWLTASYCSTFGWNEFNLRLFEGLFGILGVIITFFIARIALGNRTSFVSSLILGSSLYYIVISRLAIFDTLLNFFILLSVYAFLRAYYNPARRVRFSLLFALSAALAVLTKGPIGIVHPLMVVVPFLLWKREWRFFFDKRLLPAVLLFLAITVPWYAHQLALHGQAFFDVALRDYTWYRFFGVVEHQDGPWYYYIPVLLFFYPWIFFLPGAVTASVQAFREPNSEKKRDLVAFSWTFIIITFLFFSVAQTKLPNYIFTIFPFMAILLGVFFYQSLQQRTASICAGIATLTGVLLAALATTLPIPAPYDQGRIYIEAAFLLLAVIPFTLLVFILRRQITRALYGAILGSCVLALFLTHVLLPYAEQYKESRFFVQQLQSGSNYLLINFKGYSPYLMYYLNHPVVHASTEDQVLAAIEGSQEEVFLIVPRKKAAVTEKISSPCREVAQSRDRILYAIAPQAKSSSHAIHGKELD